MLENASFKDEPVGLFEKENFFPFWRLLKVGADAKGRAPVEIVRGIIAVSQCCGNRNDALVLVVGEGYEDMDNVRLGLSAGVTSEENAERR